MPVTAIKGLVNHSAQQITIVNKETYQLYSIRAGEVGAFDIWIPWCANAQEFSDNHVRLSIPRSAPSGRGVKIEKYYIWQNHDSGDNDDLVRFSTDNRYHGSNDGIDNVPGVPIPGDADVGGNRIIIVNDRSFRLEKIKS